jgi:hypothetical protein
MRYASTDATIPVYSWQSPATERVFSWFFLTSPMRNGNTVLSVPGKWEEKQRGRESTGSDDGRGRERPGE